MLSALASLRSARAEIHSGLKLTKKCLQKRDNYLENFPDLVENDETKLLVSMYLCWMKSSINLGFSVILTVLAHCAI